MRKEKAKIFILLLVAVIALVFLIFQRSQEPIQLVSESINSKNEEGREKETVVSPTGTETFLIIDNERVSTYIESPLSALSLMQKLQSENKLTFTTKKYSGLGILVDSINKIKGEGGKYWIYSVNGIEAQVGVSDYTVNPGDVVSWEYRNSF